MITELMIANPKTSVVVLSFLVTLFMTVVTKKVTDQKRMKELKDMQKKFQGNLKEVRDDAKEMAKIQKEMMETSIELMKHSFRPMIYTFLPLIILFWWIRNVYAPVLPGWIWWYIGAGIVSSIVLRKALKVV